MRSAIFAGLSLFLLFACATCASVKKDYEKAMKPHAYKSQAEMLKVFLDKHYDPNVPNEYTDKAARAVLEREFDRLSGFGAYNQDPYEIAVRVCHT